MVESFRQIVTVLEVDSVMELREGNSIIELDGSGDDTGTIDVLASPSRSNSEGIN